ncbi:hypothetical protein DMJ13_09740 [halophilic archaeon]|nr:hypothetical protein DMJ13_09740 [halophilic archaeon]
MTVQWGQGTGRSPSTAVVQAVSAVTEIPPRELPPLHRTIDADALNGLFSPRDQSEPDTMGVDSVSFEFEGYDVTVTAAGYVSMVPLDRRQ